MKKLLLLLFAGIIVIFFTAYKEIWKDDPAPRINMKDFFKNGTKSTFRISPDGKYYSYRADYMGKMNVFVQKTGSNAAVRVTNDTLCSIGFYFWKGDRIVYTQDIGGDENFQLYSVRPDGSDLKPLTPFTGYRSDVIDALTDIPGREKVMIVGINKRVKEYFDPYLINTETGKLTLLYDNKQNFDSWYVDNNGVIRMATRTDGVNVTYYFRNTNKDTFNILVTTSFKEQFSPIFRCL